MAFSNYLIYSDLMKQLSASQPSEMAVSLVSSSPNPVISAPSPLKRHLEPSPLKHIVNPGAINSPVRLLSDSIASKMISNSENGSIVEPIAKRLKLDSSLYKQQSKESHSNNNAADILSSKSASIESLKNGIKLLAGDSSPGNDNSKSYSCGWMSNTSPMRHPESGDAPDSPQPPTLNPISSSQHSDEDGDKSPAHLPALEPPPLLIKPLGSVNSPSRSSTDGEISLENTDPNADPMDGHEVCPECQKVFKRKIYLQRHMEREHWSTAKVFKCEDCNYETKHQSNLSVHRRTHTGERPYHCGACGQRYTQGHLLKSHIRSRHGGNMQFYNLDKKSDSTRGRKSLDLKHDIGGVAHRQDKISTLLQAAAAASNSQNSQSQKSPFGGLISPNMSYMSSLAPYYGLQQSMNPSNLSVRPMMTSPLALNAGLLGGSRFFALSGLPNNLPTSSMLPKVAAPNLSIFSTPSSVPLTTSSLNASSLLSKSADDNNKQGEGLLMKVPAIPAKSEHEQLSPVRKSSPSPKPADDTVPQDLSVRHHSTSTDRSSISEDDEGRKSLPPPPPRRSSNEVLRRISESDTTNEDKRSNDKSISSNISHSLVISSTAASDENVAEDLSYSSSQQQQLQQPVFRNQNIPVLSGSEDQLSECRTPQSISAENDDASAMQDQYNSDDYDAAENDDVSSFDDSNLESRDTLSPKMDHFCGSDVCAHANQLTKLRKNVMRMLRCFAPEFSENNIDYSTVEVDQLLYDVMFSNIDDKIIKVSSKQSSN